jgi:hypothetical protein
VPNEPVPQRQQQFWSPVKNYQGPTYKKYSAVKSDYYNVQMHSLE